MKKKTVLLTVSIILIVLGIAMIYLGAFAGKKLMLPPTISGVGFIIIAWGFNALKK